MGHTASKHRLGRGLPGYLILFDTHAFVPQRQTKSSQLPSQLVFYDISKHFTATCHIPLTSACFKSSSIRTNYLVKRDDFNTDLPDRLRTL
jgi:hypothetical protein